MKETQEQTDTHVMCSLNVWRVFNSKTAAGQLEVKNKTLDEVNVYLQKIETSLYKYISFSLVMKKDLLNTSTRSWWKTILYCTAGKDISQTNIGSIH